MHEIASYWRQRIHRLRLTGFEKKREDGTTEYSLTGANWVEAGHNGHHRSENPFQGEVIYQASQEENAVAIPLEIHAEVDISTPSE